MERCRGINNKNVIKDAVQRFNEAHNDVIKLINHVSMVDDEDTRGKSETNALFMVIND